MIASAGAGGTVLLRADQGAYHTTRQNSITHGGVDGSPVKIIGVDGAGNPMNAEIIGTRDEVVTTTSVTGSEVFRLLDGANNLSFEHLSFVNQGNGCFRIGADVRNLSIEHIDADNVMRFVENYASGARTSAAVDGLTVRDVEVHGFSRGAIRLQYDSHNVVLENIKGDSEFQNGDSWATGVSLEGTVHDVVIRGVTMSNSFDNSTSYWNGDGFVSERGTYNVIFENTLASNNTDGGYDIKSDHVTLINAVAMGNKRNFRFWGDNVTMIDCSSRDPHKQGGGGSHDHVWLGNGASVTIRHSTIADVDPNTIAFDLAEGNATLNLQSTTVSLNPAAQYVKYGTNSVLREIVGLLPGPDLLESSNTFSLSGYSAHKLTLTGSGNVDGFGNDLANVITGNTGNNWLQGGASDDTLIGGAGDDALHGGPGADSMAGGLGDDSMAGEAGNDTYLVDSLADQVTEAAGAGTDTIRSTISIDLSLAAFVNVENVMLLGTTPLNVTGSAFGNALTGNAGDNFLNGGAGADTLQGGLGKDTYSVDAVGDVVTEGASAGTDTVRSWISYTLGDNLENLTLVGSANNSATGNALNNVLSGNVGDNFLNGGAGADTMAGGLGNDTYSVDAVGDVVTERASAGTDTIRSWISYTLGDNLENLTLIGSANNSATGNVLNNVLTGNVGDNFLNGGAGDDTLIGGAGNDSFIGGTGNDQINVSTGNCSIIYTGISDGHDIINGFDGNGSGGQDVVNLDALFDSLGIAAATRTAHLSIDTHATGVDVRFDADGDGGSESVIATLNTIDAITVGADIVVGT
jgi:Ca2+-binding RTX toxin-like protein